MTASEIVNKQIEAYNNRNLEENMSLFSDDCRIISLPDGKVLLDGKEACTEMYAVLFANSPNLFAEVIGRIDIGNKVILHENIFGRNGSHEKLEQLIIFEIQNKKISKIYRF